LPSFSSAACGKRTGGASGITFNHRQRIVEEPAEALKRSAAALRSGRRRTRPRKRPSLSTSGLRSLDLRGVRDVIVLVLAGGDEPGEAAAQDGARRRRREGRSDHPPAERHGLQRSAEIWLPFLDTYRTMCGAPSAGFLQALEGISGIWLAA
jgi:hypothetical protein